MEMYRQVGRQDEAGPGIELSSQRMLRSHNHPLIQGTLAPKQKSSSNLAEVYNEGRWWKLPPQATESTKVLRERAS